MPVFKRPSLAHAARRIAAVAKRPAANTGEAPRQEGGGRRQQQPTTTKQSPRPRARRESQRRSPCHQAHHRRRCRGSSLRSTSTS
eukprot:2138116-Alexandrium_andersonii.AAC.1